MWVVLHILSWQEYLRGNKGTWKTAGALPSVKVGCTWVGCEPDFVVNKYTMCVWVPCFASRGCACFICYSKRRALVRNGQAFWSLSQNHWRAEARRVLCFCLPPFVLAHVLARRWPLLSQTAKADALASCWSYRHGVRFCTVQCDVSSGIFVDVLCQVEGSSLPVPVCWECLSWRGVGFCQVLFLRPLIGACGFSSLADLHWVVFESWTSRAHLE